MFRRMRVRFPIPTESAGAGSSRIRAAWGLDLLGVCELEWPPHEIFAGIAELWVQVVQRVSAELRAQSESLGTVCRPDTRRHRGCLFLQDVILRDVAALGRGIAGPDEPAREE